MTANQVAFVNGNLIDAADLHVPVTDAGFVQGITLAEQIRTFNGVPFLIDRHLDRLLNGAEYLGVVSPLNREQIEAGVLAVARHNARLLRPGEDLGITLFLTPGTYPAYPTSDDDQPRIVVHSYPLNFLRWAEKYEAGVELVTVDVTQVPTSCWPTSIKCRSRMHYYLAAREAAQRSKGSQAILLDQSGNINETPIANLVAVISGRLISPPKASILPGISLEYLFRIAEQEGLETRFEPISVDELKRADEVLLTSTPFCLLPATKIDDQRLSGPRRLYSQLMKRWSANVGVDIIRQANEAARHVKP